MVKALEVMVETAEGPKEDQDTAATREDGVCRGKGG